MNFKKINPVYALIFGAVSGSLITWLFFTQKKKRENDDASINKEPANSKQEGDTLIVDEKTTEPDTAEYGSLIHNLGYDTERDKEEIITKKEKIYVVSPEEFFEASYEYDTGSLTYYADDILANEIDEVIDDPESLIGDKALNSFGKYEDDTVFVKNEELGCVFEILRDERKYREVFSLDGGDI